MSENSEGNSSLSKQEEPQEMSVTMVDVLAEEKELEEESAAVLGGSDEKYCTYEKGYIKRQALYSCLTCCPEVRTDPTRRAAICLACSYQCHENHELIELYTKRNFRCDCPTRKFEGRKCTFVTDSTEQEKFPANTENHYNQNFTGVYCVCKRPYPDPEDSVNDEMIQCIICEDWYHSRHLDASIPKSEMYSEMICESCMVAYSFLKDYTGMAVNKIIFTDEAADVSVSEDDDKLKSELDKSISDIMNISQNSSVEEASVSNCVKEPCSKKVKLDLGETICKRPNSGNLYTKGAVFWPDNWRASLCSCPTCIKIYENLHCTFLVDAEDTVQFYEENGLKKVQESNYERGIQALSSMDRVHQIDAITEYNKMKEKLKEYLQTFVVNQKVVTEEDINRFFQNMKNEKNANLGVPYFCR